MSRRLYADGALYTGRQKDVEQNAEAIIEKISGMEYKAAGCIRGNMAVGDAGVHVVRV